MPLPVMLTSASGSRPPAAQVHGAGRDRAARHAVIAGLVGVLRDDKAAVLLHRLQAKAAVGAGARQDDADGARAAVLGQRMQQEIERQARAMTRLGLRQVQRAVGDRQIGRRAE